MTAYFHLPGLFEFHELYKVFLPVFCGHREYFYDGYEIGSIYGAPSDCLWGGGRVENGEADADEVFAWMREYGISARLTFSNSLLGEEHLTDKRCNDLCAMLSGEDRPGSFFDDGAGKSVANGIIVHSDLLLAYLRKNYPSLYMISSTTKVLTEFEEFRRELDREEFRYVVPDFRLNKALEKLSGLTEEEKGKVEFLCNECCSFGCTDRKDCYEDVSRKNLGLTGPSHICRAPGAGEGYRFSRAMKNPGFISKEDIQQIYLPMGFTNFKIEGRGLGSALVLEFLLYYMVKPEYQIHVREAIYLDNQLDLF